MSVMKRFLLYLLLLLFIVSMYKDLSLGLTNQNHLPEITSTNYEVMQVKVSPGNTIYTVVHQINEGQLDHVSTEQIIHDFHTLNPNHKGEKLKTNKVYFFPVYHTH